MINDNTARLFFPDGEVRELASPQGLLWERAVRELKSRLESAYVTRNNGIKGLKAYGGSPVKHKQDKLWGRYVPCEYIESRGTQYIDTGFKPNQDTKVDIDVLLTSKPKGGGSIFGAYSSTYSTGIGFYAAYNTGDSTFSNYYDDANINHVLNTDTRYNIIADKNKTYIDDVLIYTHNAGTGQVTNNLRLMGIYIPSGSTYPERFMKGQCYRAKIYDNNTLVRDFIPVKDVVDNVYGLWDRVGNKFYGNDGTGAFTGGELIQPIAYAESDGTAYCDTGYVLSSENEKIITDAQITDLSYGNQDKFLFGTKNSDDTKGGTWVEQYRYSGSLTQRKWYVRFGSSVSVSGLEGNSQPKYHIELSKNKFELSTAGQVVGNLTPNWSGTFQNEPVTIFGRFNPNDEFIGTSSRFWNFTILDGTETKLDYLPVRIGTTVELLDLISWTFATRVGNFIAGPDVPYAQIVPDIIKVNTGDVAYGVGKNLFDGTSNLVFGKYIGSEGVIGDGISNYYCETYFPIKLNTSYVFWGERKSDNHISFYNRIHFYDADKTFILSANADGQKTVAVSPANAKYARISCNVLNGGPADPCNAAQVALFNWYFGEGTATTEYEPYHFGIHTNGTHKVIVGSQGVVDMGTLNWTLYDIDLMIFSASISDRLIGVHEFYINGYTYTTKAASNLNDKEACCGTSPTGIKIYVKDSRYADAASFKAAMSGKLLFYQRNTDASFVPPQVRNVPMLLSTDSNLDVQSGVKTEAWGVKVLTGTEDYAKRSDVAINYNGLNDRVYGTTAPIALCTHFNCINSNEQTADIGTLEFNVSNSFNHFFTEFGGDVTAFKAWLADQYAKGNPVIILYPLATPVTEQVTIAPVTSQRRTTYVADSDSELGKLNLTMQYLGKYGIPQPADEIWYTTTDGNIVELWGDTPQEGLTVVSNTYADGKGVIKMSGNVTRIRENVFEQLDNLATVMLPDTVTTIGDYAFNYCENLTSITLPRSLTQIGNSAFSDCTGLRSITLPASITDMGDGAFQYCEGLESITCLATTPPAIYNPFYGSNCPIYVPASSVAAYKAATNWRVYENRIRAIQ